MNEMLQELTVVVVAEHTGKTPLHVWAYLQRRAISKGTTVERLLESFWNYGCDVHAKLHAARKQAGI